MSGSEHQHTGTGVFCTTCGQRITEEEAKPPSGSEHQHTGTGVFCTTCGQRITEEEAKPPQKASIGKKVGIGCGAFFAILIVLGIIGAIIGGSTEPDDSNASNRVATATPQPASKDLACLEDVQCVSGRTDWLSAADVYCDGPIEDLAQYSAKWTDGFFENKFHSVRLMPPDYRTVTYVGDKVQFQNGFGAWMNMDYTCVFDPLNNQVIDVNVG